ncbi:UNC13A_B_C [Lepeophtheirus salmonis]|uniref:UNC13A_B_C n=1 Tax=Lepeophtheirus salmonis TaxID=72036 RepID=A0A7R8H4L9_LEPSM|nr:UNC13A_B_C [Lepeophtheirus salmonis]CAF2850779.1 UNC13A_B_C [Lepeophtheirus salmonis]
MDLPHPVNQRKYLKKKQDKIRHGSLPIGDGSYEEKEAALAMAALGGIHSDTYPRSSRKEGGLMKRSRIQASVANGKPLFTSLQSTAMMKPSSSSAPNISINTSSSSSSSASNNNNKNISSQNIKALKQQLSNPLPLKQSSTEKTRKLSLKEKRKLRAERGIRELDIQSSSEGGGVTAPGQTNIPPGHPPLHSTTTTSTTTASTVSLRGKLDSSESDQSIRSDQSASSPKLELVPPLTPKKPQEQQQNDSSNGSNGRERSSSREFAVSRALGKYREKQKLTKEKGGSSNSDSQEELDLPYPTDIVSSLTSSILTEGESSSRKNSLKHQQQGINDTLKNLDAKLAKMEEVKPLIKGKKERGKLPKSKRQSTEDESIDKEDEWYKHEMKVLEEMEYEMEMEGIQPPQEIKTNMNLVLKELREKTHLVADFSKTVLHSSMKRSNEFDEGTLDDEEEDDDIIDDDDDDTDSSHPAGALSSEDEEEDASDATQSGPDSLADSYDEVEDKRRKSKSGKSERKNAAHATTALQSGESGSAGSLSSHSKPSSSSSSSTPHRKSDGQQSPPSSTKVLPNEDSLSLTPTKEEEFEEQDKKKSFTNGYYDENGVWIESTGYYDENGDWVETGGYYDENGVWIEYAGYYDDNGEWVNVEPNPPDVAHQYTEDEPGVTGVYPGIEEDSEPPDRGGNQEEEEVKETQFNESKSADHFLVEAGVAVNPPQGQTTPVANNHNEPPSTDPDNNFLHEDDKN